MKQCSKFLPTMPKLCSLKTKYNYTAKPVLSYWLNVFSSVRPVSIMLQNLSIMLFGISLIFCLLCLFLCFLDIHYADNLFILIVYFCIFLKINDHDSFKRGKRTTALQKTSKTFLHNVNIITISI